MNVVVCVKPAPITQQVDLQIAESKRDLRKDFLAYTINEWDNYAVEEAVLLKEKLGGITTAITIGKEDHEEVLRKCLAMGVDEAVRIDSGDLDLDGSLTSRLLAKVIKDMQFDLVLTGFMSSDDCNSQVGPQLAQLLGCPHATLVTKIAVQNGIARVHQELEEGILGVLDVELPAVFAVQTGINLPRYASYNRIQKVRKKEIEIVNVAFSTLKQDELRWAAPRIIIEELFVSPPGKRAQILEGAPEEKANKLFEILKEKDFI